jgi:hypothetical protein
MAAKALVPFLLAALLVGPAWPQTPDGRLEDFLAAKHSAYRYYRSAWFYLRTGNVDLAALELSVFVEGWDEIRSRFAAAPPGAFADDPRWREDLAEIATLAAAGMTELEAADPEAANGVVTFSDAVDALTQAMENLWRYRHETADFDDAATRTELSTGTERLRAAFARVRDDAPDEIAFDDRFLRLVSDSDAAVDRLEEAVAARDRTALVNALRELRSFERLLWLNFG